MAEPLDEDKLKALLSAEIRAAVNYDSSELSSARAKAIEYYEGVMADTPPLAGRSKMVSRDVADTIGLMLPGVIRTFIASGRMVDFKPVGSEDEKFAELASDYCNYLFMKENAGYRILWDSTHDSLLQGNGIIKHYWDSTPTCEYEVMSGKTAEQLAMVLQDGAEVVAQTQGEPTTALQQGPNGQPMPIQVPTYDVKIKREDKTGRLKIDCIEPENFLMNAGARFIEEARFTAHRDIKTKSDLLDMGFDPEIVERLPAHRTFNTTQEQIARFGTMGVWNDVGDPSTKEIEVYECYVMADVDGDGISEMVRAYVAGNGGASEILHWEEWEDDCPFSDIPCEPRPHRWDAKSITDETMDVQRIKTVMLRQYNDNLYASAIPMREAEVGSIVNPEMLLSPKFGGIVWRKKGSQPTIPHEVPFFADKILGAMEYYDRVLEKRTGVSRATAALDPETLQNQTATASQLQHDAMYSQTELVARNMAELGWTRVFRQVLKLVVKHQTSPRILRLKDEPVKIDPSVWNTDMDVTVNVGLGTGSRDRDMAMLNTVLLNQTGLMQKLQETGFASQAIDMLPKAITTMRQIAESAGLQQADDYYPEFEDQDLEQMKQQAAQQAQQPDPKVQAQLQIEQAKGQIQMQMGQAQLQQEGQLKQAEMVMNGQLEQQKAQAAVTREAAQLQADLQTKAADRQSNTELAYIQQQTEREKMAAQMQIEREKMAAAAQQAELERQHKMQIEHIKAEAQAKALQHQLSVESQNKQADRQHSTGIETMKAKAKPKPAAKA